MTQSAASRGIRDARSDETRDRLFQSAIECFATKGFHATTTRDISMGAGVSPGALYVHFRSKEQLLYEISIFGHTRALDLLRKAADGAGNPAEQLTAVVTSFTTWHAEARLRSRINNYELSALTPPHRKEILALRRAIEDLLRGVIEAGITARVFTTPDAHMTSVAILSLCVDIARWYHEGATWKPHEIAGHYGMLALRMAGGRG